MGKNLGNFEAWLHGLLAAFIGGGASAATAGIVVPPLAPTAFNYHDQIRPLFALMLSLFLVNGVIAMLAYLKQSPLPQLEVVNEVKEQTIQPSGEGVKVTSVTQTTTSSVPEETK